MGIAVVMTIIAIIMIFVDKEGWSEVLRTVHCACLISISIYIPYAPEKFAF
jgi:cell division protein FtsW (lipid II flippase)